MLYVPVVSSTSKPLMPCHPAKARRLVREGKAIRRFKKGLFYLKLTQRQDGDTQPIATGVDPGSKREGFTVKSKKHTYLNIQATAVTWVKDHAEQRRTMRRGRRYRKTPCRKNRKNRARGGIPPSTKSRWGFKLRVCKWLRQLYPITHWVVEDVCAETKGKRRWDVMFSPLQVGKRWFYEELGRMGVLITKEGHETKALRDQLGLKKSRKKTQEVFESHCVDSWVLAWSAVGGDTVPDNTRLLSLTPLRFHRRQLHRLQPAKGGVRKPYGGTLSHGFRRGSLVKHPKWGVCYVGGWLKDRISLHDRVTGKRLCQNAKPQDCIWLGFGSWRVKQL